MAKKAVYEAPLFSAAGSFREMTGLWGPRGNDWFTPYAMV
ncbi:keywimysin-related RiPP [Streptomyces sp. NPDC048383]